LLLSTPDEPLRDPPLREPPLRELLPEEAPRLDEPPRPREAPLDDEPRPDALLRELPPDRELLPELREPELFEPEDFDPLRDDFDELPDRLFDPEELPRPERLEPPLERELPELERP
jgi:hypothetical protein